MTAAHLLVLGYLLHMPRRSLEGSKSQIPVGTGFSPDLINLKAFCEAAVRCTGDEASFRKSVWERPVRISSVKVVPTKRSSKLPIEAAVHYGILETVAGCTPTLLCKNIAAASEDIGYRILARDILLNRNGAAFVSMLRTMLSDDSVDVVTGDSIARYSTNNCGLVIAVHNTAHNTLRMYLACAGVFPLSGSLGRDSWTPDMGVVDSLLGDSLEQLEVISRLKPHQQMFIRALCHLDEPGVWHKAADVRSHAEKMFPDVLFSRASIVKDVLTDIGAVGLIEFSTAGTRGGKSAKMRTTTRFQKDILEPFLAHAASSVEKASQPFLRMPAKDIRSKFFSSNKHEKGVALEALAIRVMRTLGLQLSKWRVRAPDSGFSEVDVSLSGVVSCIPTKWQVQCKNTPSGTISNEDIAREVGVAMMEGATHILFLANATYSSKAKDFARSVNKKSSITVFLFDKNDTLKVLDNFASLTGILQQKALSIATERADRT